MDTRMFQPCPQCAHVLHSGDTLLGDDAWELQELGQGGNGKVFRAKCRATGCVHAAKAFRCNDATPWEFSMIQDYADRPCAHVASIICTGLTRHRTVCAAVDRPIVHVALQELLHEDLWEAFYHPSDTVKPFLRRRCFIKHLAWQMYSGILDLQKQQIHHGDVKPENVMLSYSRTQCSVKLIDLGNAYRATDRFRPGGTQQYSAPENVIGRMNTCASSDVFSVGLVVAELYFGSPLLPRSIADAYSYQGGSSVGLQRQKTAALYHLVFLSSLIAGREVWTGQIIKRCYGNFSRAQIRQRVLSCFPDAEQSIFLALRAFRMLSCHDPAFDSFLNEVLSDISRRPTAERVLRHAWFSD